MLTKLKTSIAWKIYSSFILVILIFGTFGGTVYLNKIQATSSYRNILSNINHINKIPKQVEQLVSDILFFQNNVTLDNEKKIHALFANLRVTAERVLVLATPEHDECYRIAQGIHNILYNIEVTSLETLQLLKDKTLSIELLDNIEALEIVVDVIQDNVEELISAELVHGEKLLGEIDRRNQTLRLVLFFFCVLSLVTLFLLMKVVQEKVVSPIVKLEESVSAFRIDERYTPVDVTVADEVGNLTVAFNEMAHEVKKRQKLVEESERKYRGIFENLQDVYIRTNLEGIILMASPSIHKVLGYPKDFLFVGCNISKTLYVKPEERSQMLQKLKLEKTITNCELELKTFDKGSVIVSASLSLLLDEGGEVEGVEGVFKNITPLKHAHDELLQLNQTLKSSEERLELALAGANDGVWDWNLVDNTLSFDPRYYTMAGYEPDEFPSTFSEWEKRLHSDDRDKTKQEVERYLTDKGEGKFSVEFRFLKKDSSFMWIRGKGQVVEWGPSGKPHRFIGTHSDISDIKKAQKELEESREAFRLLYQQTPIMLHNIDTGGAITEINDRWMQALGYEREEVIGKKSIDFLTPESRKRAIDLFPKLYEKQVLHDIEFQFVAKSGEVIDTLLTAHMVKDAGGEWLGARAAIIDITESKRIQEEKENLVNQLHQTQKMKAIETLSGGIAHDFNNMLGAMLGAVELLKEYLPEVTKARSLHKALLDSILRATELTQKLQKFSLKSSGGLKPTSLHKLVEETVHLLENSIDRRIRLETDLEAKYCNVSGDPPLLQNALINLGINASHAMPEGGRLHISSREIAIDEAFCEASSFNLKPGNFVEIKVEDNGCGIPYENLDRIFEPFFTTKDQGDGTGLGLASVYATIQQHNGAIMVYSEVGKGTIFRLLLPLTDKPVDSMENTEIKYGSGCILVADDDMIMRTMCKAILEKLGYEVIEAENGQVAVDLFCRDQEKIDLVLLDMLMPVMNGRDSFERIRAIAPEAVVILCSGFSKEEYRRDMKLSGLNGYIQKPFMTAALSQIIYNALHDKENFHS